MMRAVGLLLAAAGSASAAGTGADSMPQFVVRVHGQKFTPAELRIPAGVKVRVVVVNEDDVQEEFDSYALNRDVHVAPHSQQVLYLGPLKVGRYVFQGEQERSDGPPALGVVAVY